jgi:tripartite-type tricarboxylate transporter receptor subunit TctC
MTLRRRQFLHLAAAAAALPALPRIASAQNYPARPVRIIVGYNPGSSPDIVGRLMAQYLSERLGQPFVVDNRPGAGTTLATEAVVRAAADGYTLLFVAAPNILSNALFQNLSFNFIRDIAPVASVGATPFIMVVNPEFPAKTVPEFIAYAKARPGEIIMATQGTGTLTHVIGELFKMMAGVDLLHVPYHGEVQAFTEMMSGRAQDMFGASVTTLAYIKSGKLRALGVTTAGRLDELPDVPAIGEFVPGYEVQGWLGLAAPRDTPPDIIDTLNRTINAGIADPKVKARLIELGNLPQAMTPAEYRALIASETEKWAKVIKFAGIKAE